MKKKSDELQSVFAPLSRDQGLDLICAQEGHKSESCSIEERIIHADYIRANANDVLSYLIDEARILTPVIPEGEQRKEFEAHHRRISAILGELCLKEAMVDPGLGLMSRVADSLDAYVRWEQDVLFSYIESSLDTTQRALLAIDTALLESGRKRLTQCLHRSVGLIEKEAGSSVNLPNEPDEFAGYNI